MLKGADRRQRHHFSANCARGGVGLFALTNWSAEKFAVEPRPVRFFRVVRAGSWFPARSGSKSRTRGSSSLAIRRFGLEPAATLFVDDSAPNAACRGGARLSHPSFCRRRGNARGRSSSTGCCRGDLTADRVQDAPVLSEQRERRVPEPNYPVELTPARHRALSRRQYRHRIRHDLRPRRARAACPGDRADPRQRNLRRDRARPAVPRRDAAAPRQADPGLRQCRGLSRDSTRATRSPRALSTRISTGCGTRRRSTARGNRPNSTRARALRPFVDAADFLLDIHSMQYATAPLMLAGTARPVAGAGPPGRHSRADHVRRRPRRRPADARLRRLRRPRLAQDGAVDRGRPALGEPRRRGRDRRDAALPDRARHRDARRRRRARRPRFRRASRASASSR